MEQVCPHCGARYFEMEKTSKTYTKCCNNGAIKLTPIKVNAFVADMLDPTTPNGRIFHSSPLIISRGTSLSSVNFTETSGLYSTVCIQGTIYSRLPSVHHSLNTENNNYLASYFYNGLNDEENSRLTNRQKQLTIELREQLRTNHKFLQLILSHEQSYGSSEEIPIWTLQFSTRPPPRAHSAVYNAPTCDNEVGLIVATAELLGSTIPRHRSINIHSISGELQNVHSDNEFYDTLGYPIFHMFGQSGWHRELKDSKGSKITIRDYYKYYFHPRDIFNHPHADMQVLINFNNIIIFIFFFFF